VDPGAVADTTDEARRVHAAALRSLGPDRRTELALQMSDDLRRVTLEGLRERNPSLTEPELIELLITLWHGRGGRSPLESAG
jgi:hypothetical protein